MRIEPPLERCAGTYPTSSDANDGLAVWTKANRTIANTDIVGWYTPGFHHITRAEDVESVIEDFTSYKNRNGAIWSRGEMKVFCRDPFTSRVVDSLFVGETYPRTVQPTAQAELACQLHGVIFTISPSRTPWNRCIEPGAGGSRIPGIFGIRLFSSGSRVSDSTFALCLLGAGLSRCALPLRFSVIFEYGGLIP